jgi:hypothetical protein
MSIYVIGDLHLSFQTDKPMDIFGQEWKDHESILKENWQKTVKKEDTVFMVGDLSWAMYLDEADKDFEYLNGLNGRKILLKGNHDYWWETITKLNKYIKDKGYTDIEFMHNNSFNVEGINFCGTKGYDDTEADDKIINREMQRFKLSYESIKDKSLCTYALFHYPPEKEILYMMKEFGIDKCIFGHLHGLKPGSYEREGCLLVSADYVSFMPVLIG